MLVLYINSCYLLCDSIIVPMVKITNFNSIYEYIFVPSYQYKKKIIMWSSVKSCWGLLGKLLIHK